MKIKQHPGSGLWISDTGLVCMPPVKGRGGTRSRTFYWTCGCLKPDGYRMVTWQKKRYHVHRMVLETFGPVPSEGRHLVDHINRIRDDNRIENLRWATHRENTLNSPICDNALFVSEGIHGGPEYFRRYYETHKEAFREHSKRYSEGNRASINAAARERYANNPERREKQRLATERWKKNNLERHRKYMHDYYLAKKQGLACV